MCALCCCMPPCPSPPGPQVPPPCPLSRSNMFIFLHLDPLRVRCVAACPHVPPWSPSLPPCPLKVGPKWLCFYIKVCLVKIWAHVIRFYGRWSAAGPHPKARWTVGGTTRGMFQASQLAGLYQDSEGELPLTQPLLRTELDSLLDSTV